MPDLNVAFGQGQNVSTGVPASVSSSFTPQFVAGPVMLTWYGPYPCTDLWWATLDTAVQLASRYGATVVKKPPYFVPPSESNHQGGVTYRATYAPAFQYFLQFPDGTTVNAGVLADLWRHNPGPLQGGAADRNALAEIAGEKLDHPGA